MADEPADPGRPSLRPHLTESGAAAKAAREARLATALRANLRRRKAQTRARESAGVDEAPEE